ncbi:MAG TPA: farnesyl diphosphate synthase [Pseudogracilibacillus sp.]|nr:farnesyl diphosphate synthase [Pseudogracilibacillus sp.]
MQRYIESNRKKVNESMEQLFQRADIPEKLYDSMMYSLLAGGKRLRPILLTASYDSFATSNEKVMNTAIALEMIHTYSLIHDDLPAMDDDDYRRGKLTNHKQFDEATAILAGDALLTYSFELITKDTLLTANEKVFLLNELAKASGPEGMVAGQMLDMESEGKQITVEQLEKIHERKTGRLITFAIIAGAHLAKVQQIQLDELKTYAHYLGLVFQVQDDILDVIGDPEKLGKPVGSDALNEKSTYPNLLGLDGAERHKETYIKKAEKALERAKPNNDYLYDLLHHFGDRTY